MWQHKFLRALLVFQLVLIVVLLFFGTNALTFGLSGMGFVIIDIPILFATFMLKFSKNWKIVAILVPVFWFIGLFVSPGV